MEHLSLNEFSKFVFTEVRVAIIQQLNGLDHQISRLILYLVLELVMSQEIIQHANRVNTQFLVTNRHQEIVLQLLVDAHPSITHQAVQLNARTRTHCNQLHVLLLQRLIAVRNNIVDNTVAHEDRVNVTQVRPQLVVEANETEREVDFLAKADWLSRQDDLLYFLVHLQQHFNVASKEQLVVL